MTLITFVYDAGALIALERRERSMSAVHRLAVNEGYLVLVPAPVLTQVWRDPRRQHALALSLRGCQIAPVGEELAKAGGLLCQRAGTSDAVDALVVATAVRAGPCLVWTSDPVDLENLRACADHPERLTVTAC